MLKNLMKMRQCLLVFYNKIWEKVEKLLKINSERKPDYGDDDKYI